MRQVNEQVHHSVAEILSRDVELPTDVFVTITQVNTSRDLKHADVFITVLPDNKRVSTIKVLERDHAHIQRELGKRLTMKFTPHLHFKFDEGEIKAQHVYDMLDTQE